jgi:hypothetical protein
VEGRYELTAPLGAEVYGLIAFARDRLPYKYRAAGAKAEQDGEMNVPDLPLYPAAKVLVQPVLPEGRASVGHRWLIAKEDQPDWVTGFRHSIESRRLLFERLSWLKLNEKQPLYVPAGLRFELNFSTPYQDEWSVIGPKKTFLLEPGEEADIGDLTFVASPRITITVLDDEGKPVEGIPLRRNPEGTRSWTIVHNTGANGKAGFFVPSGVSGTVAVRDFPDRDAPEAKQPNVSVSYQIGEDGKQVEPCVIRLTAKQRDLLVVGKK